MQVYHSEAAGETEKEAKRVLEYSRLLSEQRKPIRQRKEDVKKFSSMVTVRNELQ